MNERPPTSTDNGIRVDLAEAMQQQQLGGENVVWRGVQTEEGVIGITSDEAEEINSSDFADENDC